MASLMGTIRAPQCMSCVRRAGAGFGETTWSAASRQQVRGKKTVPKVATVNVRLLKDVTRYGKQGSVIPLPPGRMRNQFYPQRMAEYMTQAQLKEAGLENATLERDFTFGINEPSAPKAVEAEKPAATTIAVDLDLLSHEQVTKTIARLLPKNIDFYRSPIVAAILTPKRSPSLPAASALSADAGPLTAAEASDAKREIYGSVSTADIAASIRAILAEDSEGARIVLSPEDITFAVEAEEKDRVKNLGVFEVHIKVKSGAEAVRRTVTIKAQE